MVLCSGLWVQESENVKGREKSMGEKSQSIDACPYFCHNSLYLTTWFSYFLLSFFSLFSLGVFCLSLGTLPSFCSSRVHGYLYPFYTCLNLCDFSLLSLRLCQPLLVSFQDYPLIRWLLGHYLCSEGACHTTLHFQTKVLVLFLTRSLPCLPSADKGRRLSIPTSMACIKWS